MHMIASRPKTVKVWEFLGEQPGSLKAGRHAVCLNQAEPTLQHAFVLNTPTPVSSYKIVKRFERFDKVLCTNSGSL